MAAASTLPALAIIPAGPVPTEFAKSWIMVTPADAWPCWSPRGAAEAAVDQPRPCDRNAKTDQDQAEARPGQNGGMVAGLQQENRQSDSAQRGKDRARQDQALSCGLSHARGSERPGCPAERHQCGAAARPERRLPS